MDRIHKATEHLDQTKNLVFLNIFCGESDGHGHLALYFGKIEKFSQT